MSNQKTPKTFFCLQARIDIEDPNKFSETLRVSQEMEVLEEIGTKFLFAEEIGTEFLLAERIVRDGTFGTNRESFKSPIIYNRDGTWFHFCFDPEVKTKEDAINEFKEAARELFTNKRNEYQQKAIALNKAIDGITLDGSI